MSPNREAIGGSGSSFGANLRAKIASAIGDLAECELPNETALLQLLRQRVGPHASKERIQHHLRTTRGRIHWAANSYFREAVGAAASSTPEYYPCTGGLGASSNGSNTAAAASSIPTAGSPGRVPTSTMPVSLVEGHLAAAMSSWQCSEHAPTAAAATPSAGATHTGLVIGARTGSATPACRDAEDGSSSGTGGGSAWLATMPMAILEDILSRCCSVAALCSAASACRALRTAVQSEAVWEAAYKARWGACACRHCSPPMLEAHGLRPTALRERSLLAPAVGPPAEAAVGIAAAAAVGAVTATSVEVQVAAAEELVAAPTAATAGQSAARAAAVALAAAHDAEEAAAEAVSTSRGAATCTAASGGAAATGWAAEAAGQELAAGGAAGIAGAGAVHEAIGEVPGEAGSEKRDSTREVFAAPRAATGKRPRREGEGKRGDAARGVAATGEASSKGGVDQPGMPMAVAPAGQGPCKLTADAAPQGLQAVSVVDGVEAQAAPAPAGAQRAEAARSGLGRTGPAQEAAFPSLPTSARQQPPVVAALPAATSTAAAAAGSTSTSVPVHQYGRQRAAETSALQQPDKPPITAPPSPQTQQRPAVGAQPLQPSQHAQGQSPPKPFDQQHSQQQCPEVRSWSQRFKQRHQLERHMRCPACRTPQPRSLVPVVYGFPSVSLMSAMRMGKCLLGGDYLLQSEPSWACTCCDKLYCSYPFIDYGCGAPCTAPADAEGNEAGDLATGGSGAACAALASGSSVARATGSITTHFAARQA